MTWAKIDDGFFSHPKVVAAGRDARDLYLAGLCYANRHLTDGFLPAEALRRLAADAEIDAGASSASRLVAVGLWHQTEGGWRIHDFHDHNPTRERVIATREARAESGSRGGKQKASNLLDGRQAVASETSKQKPTPSPTRPTPVPDPDPETDPPSGEGAEPAPRSRAKPSSAIPEYFPLTAEHYEAAAAHGLDRPTVDRETEKFLLHYRANGKAMKDWQAAWRNWMLKVPDFASPIRGSPNGRDGRQERIARLVRLGQEEETG